MASVRRRGRVLNIDRFLGNPLLHPSLFQSPPKGLRFPCNLPTGKGWREVVPAE